METAVLRDGAVVNIRPMDPSDADRLVRFHHTLSMETTYLRHFAFHPELSPAEVLRFTTVDHRDREAFVAEVDDEIVGVARFDRTPKGVDAEVAFVVSDAWRGRGLGTLLFARLATRARELGIERFVAETFAYNSRMLAVFQHCGLPLTSTTRSGIVEVTMDLGDGTSVSQQI